MRFGAVDQTVKNSMLMTEDGQHWFFILYDNDTIFGVRNDGLLRYDPTIDRQTMDAEIGGYAYAGHGSVLWNNFEMDPECIALARQIDGALYTAGLTYENVINMFNNLQAGRWAEAIYNQDAQYKYIGPYVNQNLNYLGSMQGSRAEHRKWWISNRFALYDALYVSGAYTGTVITVLIPGAQQGTQFSIVSGKDFYYGYGENNLVLESGVFVEAGDSHTFTLSKNMEIGSPLRIYAPYYLRSLDLSNLITYIGAANFNLSAAFSNTLGSKMKTLVLGIDNPLTDLRRNNALTALSGIESIITLENLNIAGYTAIISLNLNTLVNLKIFKAKSSGLTSVTFANGAPITAMELPSSMQILNLNGLTSLTTTGIDLENNGENIININVRNCPNISNSPELILDWLNNKLVDDEYCTVYMDNVDWQNISSVDLQTLLDFAANGGTLTLRGQASITSIDTVEFAQAIIDVFGEGVFTPGASFYIDAPAAIFLSGPTEVLEGNNAQYSAIIIGGESGGQTLYQIASGSRTGTSIDGTTGLLTTTETNAATSNLTIRCNYITTGGISQATLDIQVIQRVYPTSSQVSVGGSSNLEVGTPNTYTIEYSVSGINGNMTAAWSLTGDIASYASIISSDNEKCVVALSGNPGVDVVSGTVTLILTRTATGVTIGTFTKTVAYVDDTIAVSSATNPYAMSVLYSAGLAAVPTKMLKTEAAIVTDSQLQPGTSSSTSIFYANADFRNYCTNFDEFKWFVGLTKVPVSLFQGCTQLHSIILPSQITEIGSYAFSKGEGYVSGLSTINIPDGVITIGANAFYGQVLLDGVTLPQGLTSLGSMAFGYCKNLKSLNIPPLITTVPGNLCFNCTSLVSVTFEGTSVTNIQYNAFHGCPIENLEVPASVSTIGSMCFTGVRNLSVNSTNPTFYSSGNCILRRTTNALVAGGAGNIVVPSTASGWEQAAFRESMGTSISFPSTLLTGYSNGCAEASFTEVNLGGITDISTQMFYRCKSLEEITIPAGVTMIRESAFWQTTAMVNFIVLPTTPPSVGNNIIQGHSGLVIWVPYGCGETYKTASGWSSYASYIQELDSNGNIPE